MYSELSEKLNAIPIKAYTIPMNGVSQTMKQINAEQIIKSPLAVYIFASFALSLIIELYWAYIHPVMKNIKQLATPPRFKNSICLRGLNSYNKMSRGRQTKRYI